MSLNNISFLRNKSGLGTPLASRDHVSGVLFYNDALPAGFSTTERLKTVFSVEEAEDLGIVEGSANHSLEWYHIYEAFQKNPKLELTIGIYDVPGTPATHDFSELQLIQDFANGDLRQVGIYYPHTPLATALLNAIQAKVTELQTVHKPLNVILGPNIAGTTDLATLPDLRTLSANNVSVTIGQDFGARGKALFDAGTTSVTDLGAKLGAVSRANVNESIAWVEEFPMVTDGFEFDQIALANGDDYKSLSNGLLDSIDDKGYIFLIKHVGYAGTYNNDSYTSAAVTNDLATIENNRTIDKGVRNVRTFVLPKLGSPLLVDGDGKLTKDTVEVFRSLADRGLASMKADGEISDYAVIINPEQNVLSSGELVMTLEIVPVGVARSILINIGFVPRLSTNL